MLYYTAYICLNKFKCLCYFWHTQNITNRCITYVCYTVIYITCRLEIQRNINERCYKKVIVGIASGRRILLLSTYFLVNVVVLYKLFVVWQYSEIAETHELINIAIKMRPRLLHPNSCMLRVYKWFICKKKVKTPALANNEL